MILVKKFFQFNQSQDPVIFWSVSFSLTNAAIILGLLAFHYGQLPSQLPLFYSLAWGENQLVSLFQFTLLPSIIILIVLINATISWHLHASQFILKRLLALSSATVSLLILMTALKILYIFV